MSQIDTKIGPKIKAFRRQLGIQANKLAEEMSISPSYLNLIESGKRKIDGDLLLRVCDKLKIELCILAIAIGISITNLFLLNLYNMYKLYYIPLNFFCRAARIILLEKDINFKNSI